VIHKGDIVTTAANTVLAFQFAIGGRAGVNGGAVVEVTGERQRR
jgi:hypothetical protein